MLSRDVVLRLAEECDGWSILCPERLRSMGLPDAAVDELAQAFESDLSRRTSTIYVDGRPVNQQYGVYSLELLRWLAKQVGADCAGVVAVGRGTQSEQLKVAIERAVEVAP